MRANKKQTAKPADELLLRGQLTTASTKKLRLTDAGRAKLLYLRHAAATRKYWTLPASVPNAPKRRVLFVCAGGEDSSLGGLRFFKQIFSDHPLPVTLELNRAGTFGKDFIDQALKADYLVPMGEPLREIIEEQLAHFARKPYIIDSQFLTLASQGDKTRYEGILAQILEHEKERNKKS